MQEGVIRVMTRKRGREDPYRGPEQGPVGKAKGIRNYNYLKGEEKRILRGRNDPGGTPREKIVEGTEGKTYFHGVSNHSPGDLKRNK